MPRRNHKGMELIIGKRFITDPQSTSRAKEYIDHFNQSIKAAGGIAAYMAGQSFRRSEPTHTQAKEKK